MGNILTYYDISDALPRHSTRKYKTRLLSKVKRIVVHTTDANWTIERLARYDISPNHISSEGCAAITYHDVVLKGGDVYHTLPYKEVSTHAGGYNTSSIAVALMYRVTDYQGVDRISPPNVMMRSLHRHLARLCLKFNLTPDRVVGHRELKGTGWFFLDGHKKLRKTCPGNMINLDKLRISVASFMQILLKQNGLYSGKVDGIFGKKSKRALKRYLNE